MIGIFAKEDSTLTILIRKETYFPNCAAINFGTNSAAIAT